MTDPQALMKAIEDAAGQLDSGGKALASAIEEAAKAELAYGYALEKALLQVRDTYRSSGERLPAEDVRRAEAHQLVMPELYSDHLQKKARVDAGRSWLRALENATSARQSLLKALTEEARNA